MRLRRNLTTLSFLAPALVGIAVFFLYPLLSAVYFSFTKFDLLTVPRWVGPANYRRMAEDPFLLQSIRNTLWMVVVFVPVRIIGAIGLSMLLTQLKRGAGFFRTIFYLPALAPPVAATIAFVYLLKPGTGPVNTALGHLGIEGPLWFNSPEWAKPSLVLLGLWGIGDIMIIFLAAVLGVSPSLYEAASLDGANAWHRFRYVTLPSIRPVILFAAVTGVIYTLQYFDQAAVAGSIASGQAVTGGGISTSFGYPEGSTFTYPLWLYTAGFRYNALGYANAMAVALFVVALAVTVILLRRSKAFSGEDQ
ncbi:sugar ABC transporter permease [Actinoplanes sp. NBRC 14428]|uniref:Carbohydrate ABC transporter membrane protein 1 (CUT1 family) n=1 Tax=Pseudosporangium ferrugineum TaxID=439699 RepID=A0A2T0S610_9ACTN|nr:sugar ABC transporter permease [Pseudosporangium ferrugineum]PRY28854.1 carbohydrate ABC transporter membrane protein 1 (CUT1 family) [Pseudosporangium ferrugineum]BCJ53686.1 sugar ABC transporter permease [Actinoplanes sp. NBRC 14428]